ncbi:MAG: ATPase [Deltaproteobacteria bacterium]|nr:ATPase [Deltaproteobacteria bacterium]
MVVSTVPEKRHLVLRSQDESFPDDALQEIRQERMISLDEETNFPPCRVEIVLGIESYLYVVLRTGIKSRLPFACNAPFIQDPARLKIKDVETSPTNRWLLKRAGHLAADAMLSWLNRSEYTAAQRCDAYQIFPDVDRNNQSIEGRCGTVVEEAFEATIEDERFLLSTDEQLQPWAGCVAAPAPLLNIWPAEQVASHFVRDNRAILSRDVSDTNQKKLIRWECIEELQKDRILQVLESDHLPTPAAWHQLLVLWIYVSGDVTNYFRKHLGVRIVPVQGTDVLYAAQDVVRLGEKKLLQSNDDWEFLSKYLLVLNQNWTRYLAEQRRQAEDLKDDGLERVVGYCYEVLKALNLSETSDVSSVVDQVANAFFTNRQFGQEDCIRLGHVAAALGASVSSEFKFVARNGHFLSANEMVLADIQTDLDQFVDKTWYEQHVLHESYFRGLKSCTEAEWRQWVVATDRSRVLGFIPPVKNTFKLWSKANLHRMLVLRGYREKLSGPYVSEDYSMDDWDFSKAQWAYWEALATEDETIWAKVLRKILLQPASFWANTLCASASQASTRGRASGTLSLLARDIPAVWVSKFRSLRCLQDTWGDFRLPGELLRRTPETESLLDVEPFVRGDLDTESNRPILAALGVRDTPTGPERLLERILALAGVENPPLFELGKWYHRLDQMLAKCSTDQFQTIKNAFQSDRLILTDTNGWASSSGVFIEGDEEDVPGAALVHPSVSPLALWQKIGVADRPTVDLAIKWLKTLPSGNLLSDEDARRVRSVLPRYPDRIWNECQHWLNLEGKWVNVESLAYALTMQSLVPWKHLFPAVKEKTADLQKLSAEICGQYPFSKLPTLAESLDDHIYENPRLLGDLQDKPWLNSLGSGLRRVKLEDVTETARVREIADRLAQTLWQVAEGLQTVPYIGGTPAGDSRRADVLWKNHRVYVENRSSAKMAKAVAQEIGRIFDRQEIIDAIKICYDRSPEFVTEYLEENFKLAPTEVADPKPPEPVVIKGEENGKASGKLGEAGLAEEKKQSEDGDEPGVTTNPPIVPDDSERTRDPPIPPGPPKPSLIERFAALKNYTKEDDVRFKHRDGGWIVRTSGESFPWEWRMAGGEVRHLWLKDCCLDRETLQLESEVWETCKKYPDDHSLILIDPDGHPVEIRARRLLDMYENDELKLYPGTYRLKKIGHEQESLDTEEAS